MKRLSLKAKLLLWGMVAFLAPLSFADMSQTEFRALKKECSSIGRHFTLAPTISTEACIVINRFNSYGNSLLNLKELYEDISTNKDQLLLATTSELKFLSRQLKNKKLSFAPGLNEHTTTVLTKDLITRNLFLLDALLKEKEAETITTEEVQAVVDVLHSIASGLGNYIYSYDLMTSPCTNRDGEEASCHKVLYMAPVLWTSIAHRVNSYHLFNEAQLPRLLPTINHMLESHSQAAAGLPLYLNVYDSRTAIPIDSLAPADENASHDIYLMDAANINYSDILSRWQMPTDFHTASNSAATFKQWHSLARAGSNRNFVLTPTDVLTHARNAFQSAEDSRQKAQELLSTHGKSPNIPKLASSVTFQAEMLNATNTYIAIGPALQIIGLKP